MDSASRHADRFLATTQGLLASALAVDLNGMITGMVTGPATIYDKAMGAVYLAIRIGGGNHRLFDGGHTILGAFCAVRDASPDDTVVEETMGLLQGLFRDMTTPKGLPLANWDKATYDRRQSKGRGRARAGWIRLGGGGARRRDGATCRRATAARSRSRRWRGATVCTQVCCSGGGVAIRAYIRSDNGSEFVADAVGSRTAFTVSRSPWENRYIESFNARLCDELLNAERFYTLKEVQVLIESWRRHYNAIGTHSSLGYRPPAPEMIVIPSGPSGSAPFRPPASSAESPSMHQKSNRTSRWGQVRGPAVMETLSWR